MERSAIREHSNTTPDPGYGPCEFTSFTTVVLVYQPS